MIVKTLAPIFFIVSLRNANYTMDTPKKGCAGALEKGDHMNELKPKTDIPVKCIAGVRGYVDADGVVQLNLEDVALWQLSTAHKQEGGKIWK